MLVLSRHTDERIRITLPDGQVIALVVVELKPAAVRLGIQAPRDVVVDREEIAVRKDRARAEAPRAASERGGV